MTGLDDIGVLERHQSEVSLWLAVGGISCLLTQRSGALDIMILMHHPDIILAAAGARLAPGCSHAERFGDSDPGLVLANTACRAGAVTSGLA